MIPQDKKEYRAHCPTPIARLFLQAHLAAHWSLGSCFRPPRDNLILFVPMSTYMRYVDEDHVVGQFSFGASGTTVLCLVVYVHTCTYDNFVDGVQRRN